MKSVFADTGYFVALLDPRDQHRVQARRRSLQLGATRLITSEMVLDEVLGLVSKPPVRMQAVAAVDSIRSAANVEVVPQSSALFDRALALYRDRPDQDWSLTDCASFVIMSERGITEALAHDHHFEQAGFVALLRS